MRVRKRGWIAWETEVAQRLGLNRTPGSGNQFHSLGDVVDDRHPRDSLFRLFGECKFTEHASRALKSQEWEKLADEAIGKRPFMAIRLWPKKQPYPTDLIVMDVDDFEDLLDMARECRAS